MAFEWPGEPVAGVELIEKNGLPAIEVKTDLGSGLVYLHGAHVADWTPAGQHPVFFMSGASAYEEGTPIRGGIPVIAPWFGPADDGQHGWARIHTWEIESVERDGDAVVLGFSLPSGSDDERLGTSISLHYEVRFGATFRAVLTVKNTSDQTVRPEMALHAYWAIDAQTASVDGLEGGGYDRIADGDVPDGPFEKLTGQNIDRFYNYTEPIVIHDGGNARDIVITSAETGQAVVWNPGVENAARMADMEDDDWKEFLCVEATRVRENTPEIEPGQSAVLSLEAEVRPLG